MARRTALAARLSDARLVLKGVAMPGGAGDGGIPDFDNEGRWSGSNALEKMTALYDAWRSGEASAMDQTARLVTCQMCEEKDADGVKLFRRVTETSWFCGQPASLGTLGRSMESYGCGCELHEKVKYKASRCPRGKW